jgi:hypothetical protein
MLSKDWGLSEVKNVMHKRSGSPLLFECCWQPPHPELGELLGTFGNFENTREPIANVAANCTPTGATVVVSK